MNRYFVPVQLPENCYVGIHGPTAPVPDNIALWTRVGLGAGKPRTWRHHRFQLLLGYAGEAEVRVDGRGYEFREQTAILVFPYQNHEFRLVSSRVEWTLITFVLNNAEDIGSLRNACRCFPEELQQEGMELNRLFLRLGNQEGASADAAQRLLRDELRLRLGLFLIRLERQPVIGAKDDGRSESGMPGLYLLDRIHDYIFKKRNYLVNNGELAEAIGVSVSTLRRSVRKELGFPLSEYLRDLRLTYACELLQNHRHSVGEVAALCGYNSINAFSFAFKHHFGSPPSERRAAGTAEPELPSPPPGR